MASSERCERSKNILRKVVLGTASLVGVLTLTGGTHYFTDSMEKAGDRIDADASALLHLQERMASGEISQEERTLTEWKIEQLNAGLDISIRDSESSEEKALMSFVGGSCMASAAGIGLALSKD